VFINGLGAVTGPLITGWLMGVVGPQGFFVVIAVLSFFMAGYAAYRMTQRAAPTVAQTESYTPVSPSSSPMAVEYAQEVAIESAQDENQG
jgi:MFS family permease